MSEANTVNEQIMRIFIFAW